MSVKKVISPETLYDLKVSKLESIIEKLKIDIPLEGAKWQRNMIAHYSRKLVELKEAAHGIRRAQ